MVIVPTVSSPDDILVPLLNGTFTQREIWWKNNDSLLLLQLEVVLSRVFATFLVLLLLSVLATITRLKSFSYHNSSLLHNI